VEATKAEQQTTDHVKHLCAFTLSSEGV